MPRSGANFSALTRVQLQQAEDLFKPGRSVEQLTKLATVDALRILHDALSNPDDKYRIQAATALIQAHVKMQTSKQEVITAAELPYEERVKQLAAALRNPPKELAEALEIIKQEQNRED